MAKKHKKKGKKSKKNKQRYEGGLLSEYILPKKELRKKFEKRIEQIERVHDEELRIRKKHARFNRKKKKEIKADELLLEQRRQQRRKLTKKFKNVDKGVWSILKAFLDKYVSDPSAYASLAAIAIIGLLNTTVVKNNVPEFVLSGITSLFNVLVSI